jgi:hypothetical protein
MTYSIFLWGDMLMDAAERHGKDRRKPDSTRGYEQRAAQCAHFQIDSFDITFGSQASQVQ